jgi:Lrp/AsnC family transcriptional regulator, regulator for asnA, asnC and gidA
VRNATTETSNQPWDLDDLDRRLIAEMVLDGRASYTALSKHVGLSPAAARGRVQRLLAEHLITVSARIDARTAGTSVVELVLVTVDRPASEVGRLIGALDEAVFVVCGTGPWGLMAEVRCNDKDRLVDIYDAIRAMAGVVDLEFLPIVDYLKQDWSGLAGELSSQRHAEGVRNPRASIDPLDDIDAKIVGLLIADGRTSYADIAPKVALSAASVRVRVQRLIDEQIVVIQTMLNQSVMGRGMFAGVMLTTRGGASNLAQRLASLPETTLVIVSSGRFEVMCELWSRDSHHLLTTIDHIRSLDEVRRAECYPYLDIIKEQYQPFADRSLH